MAGMAVWQLLFVMVLVATTVLIDAFLVVAPRTCVLRRAVGRFASATAPCFRGRRPRSSLLSLRAVDAEGKLIFSAPSAQHGEIQVRELAQGDSDAQAVVRALWFESAPSVWQSAVKMRRVGENALEPDWSVLPFPSSRAHAFASALVEQPEGAVNAPGIFAQTAMVVGLGGGTLTGWLLQNLPDLSLITCSELDSGVLEVATSYFGLDDKDPRLRLQPGDGLEHAAQAKSEGRTFDLVAIDVGGSQSGEPAEMLAPPPGLRSYESLQLLCDLVSPGGVLSMTVVGGCDEEMLTLLQDLVGAREAAMKTVGGGEVVFLENRASEKWLRSSSASVPTRMIFALRSSSSSSSSSRPRGTRAWIRARAQAFDGLFPSVPEAAALEGFGAMGKMVQRLQVELYDVQGMATRIRQQSVFRAVNNPKDTAAPPTSESTASAGLAPGQAASGWERERARAAGRKSDDAFKTQLTAFSRNHPGVGRLAEAGAQDSKPARGEEGSVAESGSSAWKSSKEYQLWVYAQNNPGVEELDAIRSSAPPTPPPVQEQREDARSTEADGAEQGALGGDEDLAAEEEELRRELAEFRRRQSTGEAATEETLKVMQSAGFIAPNTDTPPTHPNTGMPPPGKTALQPPQASTASPAASSSVDAPGRVVSSKSGKASVEPRKSTRAKGAGSAAAALPAIGDLIEAKMATVALTRKANKHELAPPLRGVVASLWNEDAESPSERGLTAYFYGGGGADNGPVLFKHDFILGEVSVVVRAGEMAPAGAAVGAASSSPAPPGTPAVANARGDTSSTKTAADGDQEASRMGAVRNRWQESAGGGAVVDVVCHLVLLSETPAQELVAKAVQGYASVDFDPVDASSFNLQGPLQDIFDCLKEVKMQAPKSSFTLTVQPPKAGV